MPNYYRQIARLKQKEVSNRLIAEALSISRNTVNKVVKQMLSTSLSFIEVEKLNDFELDKLFNTTSKSKREEDYVLPDYELLTKELARPGVTVQLLWEEYCDQCRLSKKKSYQLTQFKKYFNEHLSKVQFTDIIHHKAGEEIEVDWAGTKPTWGDPDTGEIIYGYLFVGVLSFSGYTYAEACTDMKMESWIQAHNHMYHHFQGVTRILIPDNLRTGVSKHTKDEVILNRTYSDMADHYGTVIIPARVRKPKDKPLAENSVGKLTTYIIAKLRDYQFYSIEEYNDQLKIELDKFNRKKFQKKEGSRCSVYEEMEKEALLPLPSMPYEVCVWKKAKVQNNSHISFQKCYYSVPYEFMGSEVDLKIYANKFEVYARQQIICTHNIINNRIGAYDTEASHMPPQSSQYGEWNSGRYLNWAKAKGPFTYQVIYTIFQNASVEQRYYRTVHSILKLADSYSDQRLESSCQYALSLFSRPTYKNIKSILKNKEDVCQENKEEIDGVGSMFLRGGEYFGHQ